MRLFDGHSDILYDVTRRRLQGEETVLQRHHMAKLQQGGIWGLTLAFWLPPAENDIWAVAAPEKVNTAAGRLEIMMEQAEKELAQCSWLVPVRNAVEAKATLSAGKRFAFFSLEGMEAMGEDLQTIDRWAAWGIRMAMLTWNGKNLLATGAGGDAGEGLTPLGCRAVDRMEENGILLDLSHLNEGGFWTALDRARGPVLASHSNCRALCDVRRNLTDQQLRAIRDHGGVVGLNTHGPFVSSVREQQTLETLARHAAHMAEVMGVEHVACGFDYCGFMGPGNESVTGMEDCRYSQALFHRLAEMGMHRRELELIAGENLLRLLR